MKKGDMSIEFTFLIFLALIVVFIVITLIIKFALSGSDLFCKITGSCEKKENFVPDNQLIDLTQQSCSRVRTELVKHSRLCYERLGDVASRDVTLCYTIQSPGACPWTALDIESELNLSSVNATMTANPGDQKLVITYLRKEKKVSII